MKTDKAPEPAVKEAVALLLKLKGEHKALTGEDFPVPKSDKRAGAAADPNQPAITKLDIRVGKIVKVWTHETADKVLIFVHLARSDV